MLGLLSLSYVVNYLDRYVLSMLAGPIKAELGISDGAMGLLLGPAFALLYTGLGVPVAWLADRGSRRTLIAAGGEPGVEAGLFAGRWLVGTLRASTARS